MKKTVRILHIAIVALCALVVLACLFMLARIFIDYSRDSRVYENVNQGFETLEELPPVVEIDGLIRVERGLPMTEAMKSQYEYLLELKATYPDVVGFISIPSVAINYPVVQTDNNSYYLDHLITGEEGKSGTVFLDCRCDSQASVAKNTVLYGHNMNNRTMFHNIELLFEKDVFLNATVEYVTEEGIFIYRPLSVYRTDENDIFDRYVFAGDEEYLSYCDEIVEKSRFEESLDIFPAADSGVITFVTCTNFVKTERYIYQAVLEKVYVPESDLGGES